MNSNTTDKKIKDKVNSVDTLQGGIVFGKEEAWDKLQARMDEKPTRKLVPFYRLAAAAILLLIVCIAAFYRTPEVNSIVHDNKPITTPETTPVTTTTPKITTAPLSQPETTQRPYSLITHNDATAKLQTTSAVQPQPIAPQVIADTLIPEPVVAVVAVGPPAQAPKSQMRVVHINEVDHPAEVPPNTLETPKYNQPSFVIFTNKVMHINDVTNEEREERQYHKNNRVSVGITFMRPPSRRAEPTTDNDNYTHSFLKINLN